MPCAGLKQIHTGIYSITQYLLKQGEKYRINWLQYKLKRKKKKKKQQQGGEWAVEEEEWKKRSYLWWIKALKKCILHIQWKLKLHQVRLVSLKRGKGEKIPLGGRRVKKKKKEKVCIGGVRWRGHGGGQGVALWEKGGRGNRTAHDEEGGHGR